MPRMRIDAESSRKTAPDWERIEVEYRAGVRSLREIAAEHGISHGAINKRAKRDRWERDLSAKIQAKADALVSKAEVSKQVSTETLVTEREVIDANAQAIVQVRMTHRKDIARSRSIVMAMMVELEASCGAENAELLASLGDMMRSPDEYGRDKLNDLYQAVVSLPGRAKTMKDLASSLAVLIDKEREAFAIGAKHQGNEDSAAGPTKTLTDAERAVRLSRLLSASPSIAEILLSKAAGNA
jgi:hypothetical protein